MYKATGSFHTNETAGSTRMYKGTQYSHERNCQ
jgi:hypothetical protein